MFVWFLLYQNETNPGNTALEVSDNLVVECSQGDTITVGTSSGNCRIETFDEARLVVFMLQAIP